MIKQSKHIARIFLYYDRSHRLPKELLALFGRRIRPVILVELYDGTAGIQPINTQEAPTDSLPTTRFEEGLVNVSSPATRNSTPILPIATEKDLPDIPHTPSQDDPVGMPYPEPEPNPTNTPLAIPQQQLPDWIMREVYEVW